ncbi:predicted protein [Naegleria gruberi]|uniref:Predicted protein n=1 Tax=Naegleria gruberi TaxID=5762 RepID=D2V7P7_NAEGR|nr:uncharacterized protein NAEGRDRAFT_64882 [Naegleria gruberi]EFC46908.1 predicted protein [Naegleria gruberi]|eukprot:XP_002679652.1 predicted protein [Naegleria gruberi strain NEG-M]
MTSLFRHSDGSNSATTLSTLYEPLISTSNSYYEPLSKSLSSKSSSSSSTTTEKLSERDHIASYQCASKLNECCKRHDWIGFGSLLSPHEIEKGINELQSKYDKEITPQTYISIFIPRLMKSNRGKYNNLVDFEFRREFIFSNLEVAFVFNYIYKNNVENGYLMNQNGRREGCLENCGKSGRNQVLESEDVKMFEEEEVLWVRRESPNHCWKVQFSGTPIQQSMAPQCCIIL